MTERGQRGQALPLALACLACLALLFAFCLKSSERLIQRERVRARADVTAFSGGVNYARGLNILKGLESLRFASYIATYYSGTDWTTQLNKLQTYFVTYGPYVSEAVTLNVGFENGLLAVPFWNKPVLFKDFSYKDLKPAYNVEHRGIISALGAGAASAADQVYEGAGDEESFTEVIQEGVDSYQNTLGKEGRQQWGDWAKEALPGVDFDKILDVHHYEYERRSDGQTVVVPKEDAGPVQESDGRGGTTTRNKQDQSKGQGNRYVSESKGVTNDIILDMHETGPHVLTLVALQPSSKERDEHQPGWVLALAQVQVAGDEIHWGASHSGHFGATFVPVRLMERPKPVQMDSADTYGTGGKLVMEGLKYDAPDDKDAESAGKGEKTPDFLQKNAAFQRVQRWAQAMDDFLAVQH